jgi:ABC-type nitrate/sulfonate/bicarbonate transport system substrate-binding protein
VNDGIIKAERPVVAKFARTITEAIHYIKADKETTKAKAAKQIGLTISPEVRRGRREWSNKRR